MYYTDNQVDVLIFVEHIDRELDSAIRVLEVLNKEYKLSVGIASIEFDLFYTWKNFNPKVICLPYCKSSENLIVRIFKRKLGNNVVFINMQYEQILSRYSKLTKRPRDDFAKKELFHFTWGEYFKNYLIDNGVTHEHIYITGKPEIEILLKEINTSKSLTKSKLGDKFGLSTSKRWLFLPLNDGIVFEELKQIEESIKKGSRGQESLILKEYITESVYVLLDWLMNCDNCLTTSNIEIILRPHPSVSSNQYNELIKKRYGHMPIHINVIKEFTAKEWVVSSDICITNYSSVALDSAAVGIPTYIIEHRKRPTFSETEWISKFPTIESYQEFLSCIDSEYYIDECLKQAISEYIDTDKNSILCTAEYINDIYCSKRKKIASIDVGIYSMLASFCISPLRLIRTLIRTYEMKWNIKHSIFVKEKVKYDFLPFHHVSERLESRGFFSSDN